MGAGQVCATDVAMLSDDGGMELRTCRCGGNDHATKKQWCMEPNCVMDISSGLSLCMSVCMRAHMYVHNLCQVVLLGVIYFGIQTIRQRTFRQPTVRQRTIRQRTIRQRTFRQNRQGVHFANLIFLAVKLGPTLY